MPLDARVFQLAKEADRPESNQDAWRVDAAAGMAAIADGVTSSLFARQWASILVEAAVADPPDPNDGPAFARWLSRRRHAWSAEIDVSRLVWFQKAKLREGAFSTLLWVRVWPPEEPDGPEPWRIEGYAVGDSCLMHLRQGELLRTFPMEAASQFHTDPLVIGSVNLHRDDVLRFARLEDECRLGDLLVLCTDAVAEWAVRQAEQGNPPEWEKHWDMTDEAWQEEVLSLRQAGQMRCDDATLLLLRVTEHVPQAPAIRQALPAAEADAAEATAAPPPLPAKQASGASPGEAPSLDAPAAPASSSPPQPPPLPEPRIPAGAEELGEAVKAISQQVIGQVSHHVAEGMKKLQGLKQSAASALRKYRQRVQKDEPPEEKDEE